MEVLFDSDTIIELIPQRMPIVMVDKFFGIENDISKSGLTISEDNIFCLNNSFAEAGIIEHIAQSAAARIGYLYGLQNKSVALGFIGSIDKLNIHFLPNVGDELYTEIAVIQEVNKITLIEAVVKCNQQLVADCRMKIFLKPEE